MKVSSLFVVLTVAFYCCSLTIASLTTSSNKYIAAYSSIYNNNEYSTQILLINPLTSSESNIDIVQNVTLNLRLLNPDILSFDQDSNTLLLITSITNTELAQINLTSKTYTTLGNTVLPKDSYAYTNQGFIFVEDQITAYLPVYDYVESNKVQPNLYIFDFGTSSFEIVNLNLPNCLNGNGVLIQGYNPNINSIYTAYKTILNTVNLLSYSLSNPASTQTVIQNIQGVSTNIDLVFTDLYGDVYLVFDNSSSNANTPEVIELTVCKIVLQPGNAASCIPQYTTNIGLYSSSNHYSPYTISEDGTQLLFISSNQDLSLLTLESVSINSGFTSNKVTIPNIWSDRSSNGIYSTIFSF